MVSELEFLRSLRDLINERIRSLEQGNTTEVTTTLNESSFLQKCAALPWNQGNRENNQYVRRVDVPNEVADYIRAHGRRLDSGYVLFVAGYKFILANSGVLGRDLIE